MRHCNSKISSRANGSYPPSFTPTTTSRSPDISSYATDLSLCSALPHQAPYQWSPSAARQRHRDTPQKAQDADARLRRAFMPMYGRRRPERKACKRISPEGVFRPQRFIRVIYDFHDDRARFKGVDCTRFRYPIPQAGWARPDLDQDSSPVSGLLLSRSGVRKSPCSRRMEPFQR